MRFSRRLIKYFPHSSLAPPLALNNPRATVRRTMIRRIFSPRLLPPLLGGVLLSFAYPGWDIQAAVWIWLFPVLWVLWPVNDMAQAPAGRRAFAIGMAAGLGFWIPNLTWLRHSSRVISGALDDTWIGWGPELLGAGAVFGLALVCSLYWGLWAWFSARFARPDPAVLAGASWQSSTWHSLSRAFLAAAAWTGCEWLRGTTLFNGFGWNGLGVALHENRVLIQAADIIGVTGLSYLPVFIACTAWNTLTRVVRVYQGAGSCRSRLDFTLAMLLLLGAAGYGIQRLGQPKGETVTVRAVLVQPNVAQVDAWTGRVDEQTYSRLHDFTRLYGEARDGVTHTDLVIWPESALPRHFSEDAEGHAAFFDSLLKAGDFSLLTGTEMHDEQSSHVSALLMRGSAANRQQYDKVHLVPFGEYLPFRTIPPFSWLRGVLPGDFDPGVKTEPLRLEKPAVEIIPLICFEDTVGRLARRFARPGPQMIVNLTNDGWFLQSRETAVHLANAKFRAIELRRPMVRAANTGVTCFIDTLGRVTSRLTDPETGGTFLEGCLPGEAHVPAQGEMTFYARHGDAFSILMLLEIGRAHV